MKTPCKTTDMNFSSLGSKKVQADFDDGTLTSDAGMLLLAKSITGSDPPRLWWMENQKEFKQLIQIRSRLRGHPGIIPQVGRKNAKIVLPEFGSRFSQISGRV